MKTLHLKLKRDVLIVDDAENGSYFPPNFVDYTLENEDGKWKFLCQGTPTEEQAAELVEDSKYMNWQGESGCVDYKVYPDGLVIGAVESFLSAISSEGWNWLVNPYQGVLMMEFPTAYERAESRTFKNPIIFIKE